MQVIKHTFLLLSLVQVALLLRYLSSNFDVSMCTSQFVDTYQRLPTRWRQLRLPRVPPVTFQVPHPFCICSRHHIADPLLGGRESQGVCTYAHFEGVQSKRLNTKSCKPPREKAGWRSYSAMLETASKGTKSCKPSPEKMKVTFELCEQAKKDPSCILQAAQRVENAV